MEETLAYFVNERVRIWCNKKAFLEVEVFPGAGAWVKIELDQPAVCRLVAAANRFLGDYQEGSTEPSP